MKKLKTQIQLEFSDAERLAWLAARVLVGAKWEGHSVGIPIGRTLKPYEQRRNVARIDAALRRELLI